MKDGWTITHDPFHLQWGGSNMYVDLGAERLVAAEKAGQKIAIEIKGFAGLSPMTDLERAIGQFTLYQLVLAEREPDYSNGRKAHTIYGWDISPVPFLRHDISCLRV